MPHVSFYILSSHKNPLDFTCQLAQTVLNKSTDMLAILCPESQLTTLDDRLWGFSETAFIAHSIIDDKIDREAEHDRPIGVILTADDKFAREFEGILINLTAQSLTEFNGTRLLEVISEAQKFQGRTKYRQYQQQNWQLTTFQL